MKGLLFLARIALISNLFFWICLIIQRLGDFIQNNTINGPLIILGWILAPFINFFFLMILGYFAYSKRPVLIPKWMILFNVFCLIMQILVHLVFPA